jgi:biopolymer transport protein ExbB
MKPNPFFRVGRSIIARPRLVRGGWMICVLAIVVTVGSQPGHVFAQADNGVLPEGAVPVDADMVRSLLEPGEQSPPETVPTNKPSGIDLLSLISQGGGFMIPIGLMSFLVVTLAVERFLSLRQSRVIPKRLVDELEGLSDPIDRFNPSMALAACRKYPSATATAIRSMLMRTGQPLADIERAATEAIQREADDSAAPIRWLSLAAAATPLMGLLGTVWGMIVAFHESTTLTPDRSRSEQLSEGIYTALVTTLAGLVVAIPAAILAQYLENRLAKYFHRIERLAFALAPGLSRFVGRARLDEDGTLRSIAPTSSPAPPTPTVATPSIASAPPVSTGGKAERVSR